jgi:hypothetical protein
VSNERILRRTSPRSFFQSDAANIKSSFAYITDAVDGVNFHCNADEEELVYPGGTIMCKR